MRKQNCISDFIPERNAFLLARIRAAYGRMRVVNVKEACARAVEDPAPRFWVNECRAALVLGRMMRGKAVAAGMIPEKRRMYQHLFAKVRELIVENPGIAFQQAVTDAVNSSAPCSFMSGERLRKVLYEERGRMRSERRSDDGGRVD